MGKFRGVFVTGILLISTFSYAGRESHGGQGVLEADAIYALDVYEFGFHNRLSSPVEFNDYSDPFFEEFVKKMHIPRTRFYEKFNELLGLNGRFAEDLRKVFKQIHWELTDSSLEKTNDDYTDLDRIIPEENIVQLAVRKEYDVQIDRDKYLSMSTDHRLVLLYHEALSLYYFKSLEDCPEIEPTSKNVRRLVALLFIDRTAQQDFELNVIMSKVYLSDCWGQFKPKPSQDSLSVQSRSIRAAL